MVRPQTMKERCNAVKGALFSASSGIALTPLIGGFRRERASQRVGEGVREKEGGSSSSL